jgi:RNA polymerase sigma factor
MATHRETLEERVIKARGKSDLLNTLIKEFKPFIASVAQKKVGHYLEYGADDELSVALMAFKEAVDSFRPERGRFLAFARMVISMRLIDYFRKQDRFFEDAADDDQTEDVWERQSIDFYRLENEDEDRKEEVISYSALLSEWDIRLNDLVMVSPRSQSLKDIYQQIAWMIAEDSDLLGKLKDTGKLPLKEIENKIPIHRKKLERGRIYIIAMVLAIISGLSYINIGRGGD